MKNFDEYLPDLISCGMITLSDVRSLSMEELMNKMISEYHKYKITKTSDNKWTTYVEDRNREHGRRLIKKTKEIDLYNFLIDFYNIGNLSKGIETFDSVFKEWIEYKKTFINVTNTKHSISPSTIRRYERDYENYIARSDLSCARLNDITSPKLEIMLSDIIKTKNLTEKCTKNILSGIRQSFKFARRNNYIAKDAMEYVDVDLLLSSCRFTSPKDEGRVLTRGEMSRLYRQVRIMEEEHPYYMPNYCIELAMYTGMRVGEIAALHWGDVGDVLHIDFSEHRLDYSDKKSELIISEPKNGKHRVLQITDEIRDLFDRVRAVGASSDEDFIFVRADGSRFTGHDIGCAVSRRAKEAGIENTSIHEIRRTVSSLLNTRLPQRVVADMLGHSEHINERHYNYSIAEDREKKEALKNVIQSYSRCL